jgi:hypothetical protein
MSAAPTLADLFYRDPAVGLSGQFCSSKEELAKSFGPAFAGWRYNFKRLFRDSANIISMLFWIE